MCVCMQDRLSPMPKQQQNLQTAKSRDPNVCTSFYGNMLYIRAIYSYFASTVTLKLT